MNDDAAMTEEKLTQVAEAVEALGKQLKAMRSRMLRVGGAPVAPRLFLRGQYIAFDQGSEALQVRIEGTPYWYPLADYYSAYLPIPGAQVLVLAEPDAGADLAESRPQVVGFERDGRASPAARRIRATVEVANVNAGTASLRVDDQIVVLDGLDERIAPYFLNTEWVTLRGISVPPDEYWIPENWQPPEDLTEAEEPTKEERSLWD